MSLSQTIDFDLDLINRYNTAGPRYTSYPTAVQFHEGFGAERYAEMAKETNASGRPLSLYFHIPFCDTVCFYCACNKVVTKDRTKAKPYLDRLYKEMAMQGALFDKSRPVTQLHWGGGTPTFISHDEMTELMGKTAEHFGLLDDDTGEYSIEIDPREVDDSTLGLLRKLGFNRISLGVQDFDERVQKSVNRVQSESLVLGVLEEARSLGFRSTSVDLIYGLPHQDRKTFGDTIDKIIKVDPARISVFNYAHLPDRFKPQRRIDEEALPSPGEKLAMLQQTIQQLTEAGYVYIGMDHFAKPDDELAVAQRDHTLYRNFQGYSTHSNCDLVGLGSTSVGVVGNSYSQNHHDLEKYFQCIDEGRLAVFRGVELDADDVLRRDVITRLICHFELAFEDVEKVHGIKFRDYFARELKELKGMEDDGLIKISGSAITVQPAGRLLIRNICMTFDRYLREATEQRFSRVI
ncbi:MULTISPECIES: oxygen-independent coproporphyrinogen III oxidase [unclassified Ectothiorhodospira]|uniref:oxygen-independent coproporphyrinogen III oxidase n=1 Tax=unclassified Ectothiorhodospira TaxID=2684909 RepID=UPI001EE97103|nr:MULTISPECIES: oxygen-independent coproporphyrinogen III oxidase [unclassified Ectothiorhodospira]MCG5515815.1 oxygen-independent coproporphyrinogen III oxidase [Ectothiorhodospira sp. 9100]MCG5518901.1 oxygen-independent coproporphyrinogen III oxidase [Ectothiorhodospira sp. 9905]